MDNSRTKKRHTHIHGHILHDVGGLFSCIICKSPNAGKIAQETAVKLPQSHLGDLVDREAAAKSARQERVDGAGDRCLDLASEEGNEENSNEPAKDGQVGFWTNFHLSRAPVFDNWHGPHSQLAILDPEQCFGHLIRILDRILLLHIADSTPASAHHGLHHLHVLVHGGHVGHARAVHHPLHHRAHRFS